jgi:hypothetical protein
MIGTTRAWLEDAPPERRALVEHALRGAVKRGDVGAFGLLRYGRTSRDARARFAPPQVHVGGRVDMTFAPPALGEGRSQAFAMTRCPWRPLEFATRIRVRQRQVHPEHTGEVRLHHPEEPLRDRDRRWSIRERGNLPHQGAVTGRTIVDDVVDAPGRAMVQSCDGRRNRILEVDERQSASIVKQGWKAPTTDQGDHLVR